MKKEEHNNNNPWMGPGTYGEEQAYKFKGRDSDIEKIKLMFQQNDIVVCYGASGNGKSSLINAGLSPVMRNNGMFPIVITFTHDDYEKEHIDFDNEILNRIEDSLQAYDNYWREKYKLSEDMHVLFERESYYNDKQIPATLWWKLRTESIRIPYGTYNFVPVLIFDQFEEVFLAKWKDEFFKWLETLCKDICPDEAAVYSQDINPPTRKLFKLFISLRYEYLAELDDWCSQKTFIPQVMQNRYFLRPLSRKQAIAVITEQPLQEGSSENCTLLNTDKDAILSFIDVKKNDEIEPVILSVLCYYLYNNRLSNQGKEDNVEKVLRTLSLRSIIRDFYENEVKRIIHNNNHLVFFEQKLVNEDGKRERIKTEKLQSIGFDKYYRKELEKSHLVRISQINKEDYVELIHDTVADAIKEKRFEAGRKKRVLWSRIGLLLAFVCIFFFTYWNQLWTSNKDKARVFSYIEYRESENIFNAFLGGTKENATYFNGKCSSQRSLATLVCDTQNVEVSNCPALKTISVPSKSDGKEVEINLSISYCKNLEYIEFSDDVEKLTLSITDCPLIQSVSLPKNLCELSIEVNTPNDISFFTNGNSFYIWKEGVLWDEREKKILYARSDAPKIINPPFESRVDGFAYRTFKVCNDTVKLSASIGGIFDNITLDILRTGSKLDLTSYDSIYDINSIIDKDLRGIKEIIFPSSLHEISYNAFENSPDLEIIDFSRCSRITLAEKSFANCHRLKRIVFPDTAIVYTSAFKGCMSIKYVKLPNDISGLTNGIFECYVDTIDVDLARCEFKTEDDGTLTYKGKPYFADNVKYHTYENNEYYSQNGILYQKNINERNVPFNIPLQIAKTLKNEVINRNGSLYYNNCNNDKELYLYPHWTMTFPNGTFKKQLYGLAINPTNLQKLHIGCSNFSKRNGVDVSDLLASIPTEIRQQVTLYVPYNCCWYYLGNPEFNGFKEIREETLLEWEWHIIKYHFKTGMSFISDYEYSWTFIALLVILVSIVITSLMYRRDKREYGKLAQRKIIFIILKSLITPLLGLVIWYVTYWFLYLAILPLLFQISSYPILSVSVSATIAFVVAIYVVYVILYSDGFSVKELKSTAKSTCEGIVQILISAYRNPMKMVKILVLILLPFILLILYLTYTKHKTERLLNATIEVEQAIKDASSRPNSAMDILYEAWKDHYNTIKGDTVAYKLFCAIYSRMIAEGTLPNVDTISKGLNVVENLIALPNGKLLFSDYSGAHLNTGQKDSIIYNNHDISSMKINDKCTTLAIDVDSKKVILDLLTWKKDTLYQTGGYALHPIRPVLAYLEDKGKTICFYDFEKKEKMKTEQIPLSQLNDEAIDICYNKKGDEIAVCSSNNNIFIYQLNKGRWKCIKEDIRGIYPHYVAEDYFSVIRGDSLVIWPIDRIGEEGKKSRIGYLYNDVKYSRNGKFALSYSLFEICILDLSIPYREYLCVEPGYKFNQACLSDDGKYIFAAYEGVLVRIPILTHEDIYGLLKQKYEK